MGRKIKCLFVEGKDLYFLNRFNEILFGKQLDTPSISYGGFSKIPRIYGTSNLFYNETNNQIKCFALADRDYRDISIIEKIKIEALKEHLELHIWDKKEIENYLIIPEILFEFIPKNYNITYDNFLLILDELLESQKDNVFDLYSGQYRIDCKELDDGQQWDNRTCNQHAREYLNLHWKTMDDKIALVGGKEFLSIINKFYQDNYKTAISAKKILNKLSIELMSAEVKNFLEKLQ